MHISVFGSTLKALGLILALILKGRSPAYHDYGKGLK